MHSSGVNDRPSCIKAVSCEFEPLWMRIRVPLRDGIQSSPPARNIIADRSSAELATTRLTKSCQEAGCGFLKCCSNQRGRDLLPRRRRTARRGDPTILNNRQRRKFSSEHNLARGAQPFVEHSAVNATEVSVEFQIAVIQVGQARVFPE